jgi:hypothetical protein
VNKRLRPAGAGYGFCQEGMNFVQKTAGLHASGKQRSVTTLQAGAFYKGSDFKIELIIYFFGHWFHFPRHDRWRHPCSSDSRVIKTRKKRFHTMGQRAAQAKFYFQVLLENLFYNIF